MDAEDKYHEYANLPIPTYEEATSSRPTSSQRSRGPEEVSDDAERQGLLGEGHRRYQAPTVESARSSEDSDLQLPEVADDRRRIEELDYLDPAAETNQGRSGLYHRARLRSRFSKQLANISATFSSLRLPFRSLYMPVSNNEGRTGDDDHFASTRSFRQRVGAFLRILAVPKEYRMSAPNFARLAALCSLAAMVYILFAFDMFPNGPRHMGTHFDPESVRSFIQENIDGNNIARNLLHITAYDHVAGTEGDLFLARWMQERWAEGNGFDRVTLASYYAYLDYPKKGGRSVKIVEPAGKQWVAKLEEDLVDPNKLQTWAWHGHSFSSDKKVKGRLIYANGGHRDDFKWLDDNGIETKGAIALVRYYGTQNNLGLKIKAAEKAGCAGVLVYSDPSDDGAGKGDVWPDGPWRPEDSVHRGSVSSTSWIVGDPLTPGWASRKKVDRTKIKTNTALPKIPSLPLSWRDAKHLIDALKGNGVKVPQGWVGADRTQDWYTGAGNSRDTPIVEMLNDNDHKEDQEIWNLHGLISGIESPEKRIIVGSHRDSWCLGSVDPGSGSAVMMEVVSIFSALRTLKWRPLRTIEFASWDASAYNLIGSTEFVEDNEGYLRDHGIAYLNVDAGVFGEHFHASGSPVFKKALQHVLSRVGDPATNTTLRQLWEQKGSSLTTLSDSSDYVPFQSIVGMSSMDLGFSARDLHAYPAGSCYQTFEWMQKFGDHQSFSYHRTLAQIWALLILEIADRPLIPFNLNAYAKSIGSYIDKLQKDVQAEYARLNPSTTIKDAAELKKLTKLDLTPLRLALGNLTEDIKVFHRFEDLWVTNVLGAGGLESANFAIQRLQYNDKLAHFESDLLDLPYKHGESGVYGLPGRAQYKHVLFAPGGWREDGHGGGEFPGIRDAVEKGDWEAAQAMVERVSDVLRRAGRRLVE